MGPPTLLERVAASYSTSSTTREGLSQLLDGQPDQAFGGPVQAPSAGKRRQGGSQEVGEAWHAALCKEEEQQLQKMRRRLDSLASQAEEVGGGSTENARLMLCVKSLAIGDSLDECSSRH